MVEICDSIIMKIGEYHSVILVIVWVFIILGVIGKIFNKDNNEKNNED